MEQIGQQVGDILIQVELVESFLNNVYEITLENKKGKNMMYYFHDSINNTEKRVPLTLDKIIKSITHDYNFKSKYTN